MPAIIPFIELNGVWVIPPHARALDECEFKPLDREVTLEECYEWIGCDMIECTTVVANFKGKLAQVVGIVDEMGKLTGKPFNVIGTVLHENPSDPIVGVMLIPCGAARLTWKGPSLPK
jgi:hypothetical protein